MAERETNIVILALGEIAAAIERREREKELPLDTCAQRPSPEERRRSLRAVDGGRDKPRAR